MGGEFGPQPSLEAALVCLDLFPKLHFRWIGPKDQLSALLDDVSVSQQSLLNRLQIVDAHDVIAMSDDVLIAVRQKRHSSMYLALQEVANGNANACISSGNSAALMALSHQLLNPLPDFDRLAFASHVPTLHDPCLIVDMGANLYPNTKQLVNYALAGLGLEKALSPDKNIKIGLLNIAAESGKGQPVVQAVDRHLSQRTDIAYVGFIEPQDVFLGKVNVLVCDGYAGNVMIKTAEGVSQLLDKTLGDLIRQDKNREWLSETFHAPIQEKFDPRSLNGAFLLGLQNLVVKSHSYADKTALLAAMTSAICYLDLQLTGHVADAMNTNAITH